MVGFLHLRLMTIVCALLSATNNVSAADYPAPKQADFIARNFRFHDGTVMPELREHYVTIGDPAGEPVLILHGTRGTGLGMVNPAYGGELFGTGQPLDAKRYFLILPDSIGAGGSSKPSDGLKAKFPDYKRGSGVSNILALPTFWCQWHRSRQKSPRATG